jgi:hypothetical protein
MELWAQRMKKCRILIRKVLICLMSQSRDHSMHAMEIPREEFICAISGRLVHIAVKNLFAAQRSFFAREDEIRAIETADI